MRKASVILLLTLFSISIANGQVHTCHVPPTKAEGSSLSSGVHRYDLKWRNGSLINVQFIGGEKLFHDKVKQYSKVWMVHANVEFQFNPDSPADILISFEQGGSWSQVGTNSRISARQGNPSMNFGWFNSTTSEDIFRRTILHEFGHALGLLHEHQHPASGIKWNKTVVYNHYQTILGWTKDNIDRDVLDRHDISLSNSVYDSKSIMHYPIPSTFTTNGYSVPWNTSLSNQDKSHISLVYPSFEPVITAPARKRIESQIESVRIEHNVVVGNQSGFHVSTTFTVDNASNKACDLKLIFESCEGIDNESLIISKLFVPQQTNQSYGGFTVFVPYESVSCAVHEQVRFSINLEYEGQPFFKSGAYYFYLDNPIDKSVKTNKHLLDGREYKTEVVNGRIWMTENYINNVDSYSRPTIQEFIRAHGSVHTRKEAELIANSIEGWRLPTYTEWADYFKFKKNENQVISAEHTYDGSQNLIHGSVVDDFSSFDGYCFFEGGHLRGLWIVRLPTSATETNKYYYGSNETFSIRLIKDE